MKSTRILEYTAVVVILLLVGSCSEFLNNPIEGRVPVNEIDYSDESRMVEPVSSLYAEARSHSLTHWANQAMVWFRSDFIFKGAHAGDQPVMEDIQDFQYQTMRNAWFVGNLWVEHFGLVKDSNAALRELTKFREELGSSPRLQQYAAEVRWFRALAYWRMLRFYGDVPFYNKDVIAAELRLSPRDEVYNYVVSELEDIVDDLPSEHPNQLEREGAVTKWAAYMLLAKISADFQDYETMLSASEAIVNEGPFSLHPNYKELFRYEGQLSDGNIFELQYTDFGNSSGYATSIGQYWVFPGIKQEGGTKYNGEPFQSGWGFSMPAQKFVDLMEDRDEDIRLETTIIEPNTKTAEGDSIGSIPSDLQSLLDRYNENGRGVAEKYFLKGYIPFRDQTEGRHQPGGYMNITLFRYADALLLYAEALVHQNGPGAGDQYINQVRERANMSPVSGADIDDILEERAAELAYEWEGHRFFDLVRLDKAEGTIPNFVQGEHEFYPIPESQIQLQPGLTEPPVEGIEPPEIW